jgi:hypothetical protein
VECTKPATRTHASHTDKGIVRVVHNGTAVRVNLIGAPEVSRLLRGHADRHEVAAEAHIVHISELFKSRAQGVGKAKFTHL